MKWIFLTSSILLNVLSYLVLKSIADRPYNPGWLARFAGGLALAGCTTFLFTRSLKDFSLALAYPVFCGASIGLILVASHFIFKDKLNLVNGAGILVILAGIFLVSR
ncbi:MAG TPA: SMR family transporter [Puia sp.]|nr:SMR family transporter [Puia sp.]